MKNMMTGILIVLLAAAFIQPLIEMSVALREKVVLGAAIINSCRAARNNALASAGYYHSDKNLGDLNAFIDADEFRRFFAVAFSGSLGLENPGPGAYPVRFKANEQWDEITVWIDIEYGEASDFDYGLSGRGMCRVTVRAETHYIFRTGLLQRAAVLSGRNYNIGETRTFLIQVIN